MTVDPNLPLSHSGFPFPLLPFGISPFVFPAEKIRERWRWEGPGSLAPLPHLADEKMDSAAVSALLGGTGQVCAERGWTEQNPSLEDAAATLVTSSVGPWTDSRPGDTAPGS